MHVSILLLMYYSDLKIKSPVTLVFSAPFLSHSNQGILELGYNVNSKSSKNWKPYLFVLKHDPSKKRSILDYYKNTSKRWQKQSAKGSIPLPESFELSLAHQCSYKYTLRLTASEKTYYLACNSSQGMNKWFYWIQTQQIMVPTKGA